MPTHIEHLNRYHPPINGDEKGKSLLAWITLGLGLGSWFVLPLIGALGAVVCGCVERRKIAEGTSSPGGRSLVTLGMIFGGLQLGLFALSVAAGMMLALMMLFGGVLA